MPRALASCEFVLLVTYCRMVWSWQELPRSCGYHSLMTGVTPVPANRASFEAAYLSPARQGYSAHGIPNQGKIRGSDFSWPPVNLAALALSVAFRVSSGIWPTFRDRNWSLSVTSLIIPTM
jgi:hypothetical protein